MRVIKNTIKPEFCDRNTVKYESPHSYPLTMIPVFTGIPYRTLIDHFRNGKLKGYVSGGRVNIHDPNYHKCGVFYSIKKFIDTDNQMSFVMYDRVNTDNDYTVKLILDQSQTFTLLASLLRIKSLKAWNTLRIDWGHVDNNTFRIYAIMIEKSNKNIEQELSVILQSIKPVKLPIYSGNGYLFI